MWQDSSENLRSFYVTEALLWMQSEGHAEQHEIACRVLPSVVICLSLQE